MLLTIKQSRKAREEDRDRLNIQNTGVTPLWEGVGGFLIKSATEMKTLHRSRCQRKKIFQRNRMREDEGLKENG